jgi:hypothetical protein
MGTIRWRTRRPSNCMKGTINGNHGGCSLRRRRELRYFIPCALFMGCSFAVAQELKVPDRLWECESRENRTCGTWTFSGTEGTGQWQNGAVADLHIQQFDSAWIIIRRSDAAGTSRGLTGIYAGKINGDRIEGTVKWTWVGHWNRQINGTWYATFTEPSPPASGTGAPPIMPQPAPQPELMPHAATRPSIAIPRQGEDQHQATISINLTRPWTDTGLYLKKGQLITVGASGIMNWYTGSCGGKCLSTPAGIPCPDGGAKRLGLTCLSLIGRVGQDGRPFDVGEALTFTAPTPGEFLLGVNDDYLPDNTGSWTAIVSSPAGFAREPRSTAADRGGAGVESEAGCRADQDLTVRAEDAETRGEQAFKSRDYLAAGCWWQIAAEKGNAEAQFFLGIWYEYGQGGIKSHEEAMRWLRDSAIGGEIRARDYLVCTSAAVRDAMDDLLVESARDPEVIAIEIVGLIANLVETEKDAVIVDMSPGDFSSEIKFSCTAIIHARREVKRLVPDSDGIETIIPEILGSMIPIRQTFNITRVANNGTYTVTVPYIGSLGNATIWLTRTYSRTVLGPVW